MSAQPLPDRPNLEQLKRQAKELLKQWKAGPADESGGQRLRDAQLAIATRYGFTSWDALRAHVEGVTGAGDIAQRQRGIDYENPVQDVIPVKAVLTREIVRELVERGTTGVKIDASVPRESLALLAGAASVRRLDLSHRGDLVDEDLAFLEAMPQLTAISLAWCQRITDKAVGYLRRHQQLEQVSLYWTATGDEAVAALVGKRSLDRVALGNTLTDAGVARLREFPALLTKGNRDSFVEISGGRALTDQALAYIGELKGLAALDVHTSVFGSPHYTSRGVAHLKQLTALEALNFHGQLATDGVLKEIAGIPRLRSLHCQDIVSGDDGFIALGTCTTLERLSARFCSRVTDRGFQAIAHLPRLRILDAGGPRLTDAATAPLADAPALEDFGPIMFRDPAFAHIARIPNLKRLSNMYNRATTDGATHHLRNHRQLMHYSAFGTQITDESLQVLAGIPTLETLEFENCAGITDDGLRVITTLPRLRKLSAWSCVNVKGTWVKAAPSSVEAKSDLGPAGQAEGYVAETLMDYPDLPVRGGRRPEGAPARSGLLDDLIDFGMGSSYTSDGVHLSVEPGRDTRWIGVITRQAFAVPLRIEIVARPITELRLRFGRHNKYFAFDDHGNFKDPAPWFLRTDSQKGEPRNADNATPIAPEAWAHVTLYIGEHSQELFVNGELRHVWTGDFAGVQSRIGIGLFRSSLTVRELKVEPRGKDLQNQEIERAL